MTRLDYDLLMKSKGFAQGRVRVEQSLDIMRQPEDNQWDVDFCV